MASSRKIVVDGQEYHWRASRADARVWIDRHGPAILRTRFVEADPGPDFGQRLDGFADGWLASGIRAYNLHRPAMIAALTRAALVSGWDPRGRAPFDLDGFALLRTDPATFPGESFTDPLLERAGQLLEHRASRERQPPLRFWRDRTAQPWSSMLQRRPEQALVAVAGLVEFGFLLDEPATLAPSQRDHALVWADARQTDRRPGGHVLAHWLAATPITGARELADLHAWCDALLR